ncbi:hypothetical protein HDU86_004408 [Geranomyces michiganensis]|nr:hypothetical protein HDU86_004408 [Geranomyces michiganensis]
MLTLQYNASPMRFTTQIAAYGTCALSAITEAYLVEGKARDVFLMERIVAEAFGKRVGSVQQERTMDFLEKLRAGRARREDQSIGPVESESLPTHWEVPEITDEGTASSDAQQNSLATATRVLDSILERRGEKDTENSDTSDEDTTPESGARNKTFGRVYGLAMVLQTISVVSHIFLDKKSFCNPIVEGVDSTFVCRDPGPEALERTYIMYFVPVLVFALGVSFGPWLKVPPAVTHGLAALSFSALFAGYSWLAALVSDMYDGTSVPDDSFEAFELYAFNVLMAAGGSAALPSHLYQLLILGALASSGTAFGLGIPMSVAVYDIPMLLALSATAGVQVTTAERLSRRHHALRGFFLERYIDRATKTRKPSVCFTKVLWKSKSRKDLLSDSETDPGLVLLSKHTVEQVV